MTSRQTHLTGHDGGEAVQLIHQHQVPQSSGVKEEGDALLQRHAATELWLIVIIPQVCDLVEVTVKHTTLWSYHLYGCKLSKDIDDKRVTDNLLVSKLRSTE